MGGMTDRQYICPGGVPGTSKEIMYAEALVYLLGFKINQKNVLEPPQIIGFLGFTVAVAQMELKLPVDKIKRSVLSHGP